MSLENAMARASKQAESSAVGQEETATEKTPQLIKVRPVFGPMNHPFVNRYIDGETLFEEMDNWLEVQIEAGKLERV